MKITLGIDDAAGQVTLAATPGVYDGRLPVPRLWIDGRLRFKNADRLCIAQALLFMGYMGGPVTFSAPCSTAVANALRGFLAPRTIPIQSVTLESRNAPVGGRTASLSEASTDEFAVRLAPEGRFRTVFDAEQAVFASNLRTLRRETEGDLLLVLALAIMFAEDLDLRQIAIRPEDAAILNEQAIAALREAMRLTNLALVSAA